MTATMTTEHVNIRLGECEGQTEREAVAVEMWYDRHRREWVLYPVDANRCQIAEARYAFSKREANDIKKDIEAEYGI